MDLNDIPVNQVQWKQYSILVVDDEPGMLSFLQRALVSRCGVVDTAGSVEQAEPLLRRRLYDLIVLDIALPGRSGIDWLAGYLALHRHIDLPIWGMSSR